MSTTPRLFVDAPDAPLAEGAHITLPR